MRLTAHGGALRASEADESHKKVFWCSRPFSTGRPSRLWASGHGHASGLSGLQGRPAAHARGFLRGPRYARRGTRPYRARPCPDFPCHEQIPSITWKKPQKFFHDVEKSETRARAHMCARETTPPRHRRAAASGFAPLRKLAAFENPVSEAETGSTTWGTVPDRLRLLRNCAPSGGIGCPWQSATISRKIRKPIREVAGKTGNSTAPAPGRTCARAKRPRRTAARRGAPCRPYPFPLSIA